MFIMKLKKLCVNLVEECVRELQIFLYMSEIDGEFSEIFISQGFFFFLIPASKMQHTFDNYHNKTYRSAKIIHMMHFLAKFL